MSCSSHRKSRWRSGCGAERRSDSIRRPSSSRRLSSRIGSVPPWRWPPPWPANLTATTTITSRAVLPKENPPAEPGRVRNPRRPAAAAPWSPAVNRRRPLRSRPAASASLDPRRPAPKGWPFIFLLRITFNRFVSRPAPRHDQLIDITKKRRLAAAVVVKRRAKNTSGAFHVANDVMMPRLPPDTLG